MGLIFDLLLVLYFGFCVFMGYKKGFLLSVSGIVAFIASILIYKTLDLGYVYFAIIYILLLVGISLLAKIIRKLKLPIISKTDAILGTVFGALNGLVGAFAISALMLAIVDAANIYAMDSSVALGIAEKILAA